MANSLFVTATECHSGKSAVTLGLMELLVRNVQKVAFFRPLIEGEPENDREISLILQQFNLDLDPEDAFGFRLQEARELINANNSTELMGTIISRYKKLTQKYDFVLCEGSDFTSSDIAFETNLNLEIASVLDCPLALIANGREKQLNEIRQNALSTLDLLARREQEIACIFLNRCRVTADEATSLKQDLSAYLTTDIPVYVLQESNILSKPSLSDVKAELNADVLLGEQYLDGLVDDYLTAAMQPDNFINYITNNALVVTPGDRSDIILASLGARASSNYPNVAGLLLTGGIAPDASILTLARGLEGTPMPILLVQDHTYKTSMALASICTTIKPGDTRKINAALAEFECCVDGPALAKRLVSRTSTRMTPLMFEYKLLEQARKHKMRIVLPEGEEERILRATETLVRRGVVEVILLGNPAVIQRKIANLGLQIEDVTIINPQDSPLLDDYIQTYYELRKAKGVTLEQARDKMLDATYFGSMMVKKDDADGMVSGSINTTAHTIRPAFEFIKTKPGISSVSSVFFMCMKDRVLVFGDCAVNTNPTAEQLAEIAIASAQTAEIFGIEPRIAMLSYSTGTSGKGADVDTVVEATRIARERAPELLLEGPIQYDAAVDPRVARTKLPDSKVAGQATVFIFPDLNTGNNTYKAVQRSAGIVAIGPVLQGLNKPVNDLSRGCLVPDIINTVVITAIQAQAMKNLS